MDSIKLTKYTVSDPKLLEVNEKLLTSNGFELEPQASFGLFFHSQHLSHSGCTSGVLHGMVLF